MLRNRLMQVFKSASVEPAYSTNSLLLMPNGINNSVAITDSSSSPKAITVVGDTKVLTDKNPFNLSAGSFYFDGVGDYLTTPSNASINNLGTGNFVISLWFLVSSTNSDVINWLIDCSSDYPNTFTFSAAARPNGVLTAALGGASIGLNFVSPSNIYPYDTWNYLEINCVNNIRRVILNGIILGSNTSGAISLVDNGFLAIGSRSGIYLDFPLKGNIAYLRIAKNATGNTESYSLPTSPPPTS